MKGFMYDTTMSSEPNTLILEKLEFLRSMYELNMLWWVSAVVFCATMLGFIWAKRVDIYKMKNRKTLAVLIYVFLISVGLYGLISITYGCITMSAMREALPIEYSTLFDPEYKIFIYSMMVGTSSFIIVVYLWHCLWQEIQAIKNPNTYMTKPVKEQ